MGMPLDTAVPHMLGTSLEEGLPPKMKVSVLDPSGPGSRLAGHLHNGSCPYHYSVVLGDSKCRKTAY